MARAQLELSLARQLHEIAPRAIIWPEQKRSSKEWPEMKSAMKKVRPARGPLRSMRVSDGFREFVLDQLAGLKGLRARSMFGGVGLYADDVFFGILAGDTLFFKADDTTRREYETAGSSRFKPYADRAMTMPYYNVPVVVLEDPGMLGAWATRALTVARASKTAKPAGAGNPARNTKPVRARKGLRR
jgi:DNA transformation protein